MQGNEACVEGAIAAGCMLFAGYPITPATEIAEFMAGRLPRVGGVYVQGEDELASLGIVAGASAGGWKAMTATSGNGICLMQEEIGYAAMAEIPCVIVDAQRAGPGTGAATKSMQGDVYQVRYGSNADYSIIALAPSSPQEMFDLTIEAFNYSETYRTPVFILSDEIVSHMRERVTIPAPEKIPLVNRKKPDVPPEKFVPFRAESATGVPPMPSFGDGYALPVSSFTRTETGRPSTDYKTHAGLVQRLWDKIEKNVDRIVRIESNGLEDAEVAVVSYGSVARASRDAVRRMRSEGMRVAFVRLITLWPFPDERIREVAQHVKALFVPEMNLGKMVREVERVAGRYAEVFSIPKPGVEIHTPVEIQEAVGRIFS
ncbi:MAG: 2-oxoacid:acceptor oxidoreductase subunit alpha [Deltaproteobacteria bacterium]|nr:2-oxoacid:acceptor oxidoreductase subunit alpha [Deltaproteobacteria bacterium]MBW2308875.1 2-oxoacid:acceptor oxidoreductase subunit alpha [Deltaproteobacteria bacterium]